MPRQVSDWLNAYMDYSEQSESPDNFHWWCGISTIASCLQRRTWFDMGFFRVYPNMYIVLVGPPGSRKNAAINISVGLLNKLENITICADVTTKEALVKDIERSAKQEEIDGKIYTHSSITIISKELSTFLGTNNIELLSWLTDLFDSHDRWEYKTKNSGTNTIFGLWVNLLGGSTPTWLVGSVPLNAIGGGFTSRIVFVVEAGPRKRNAIPTFTEKEIKLRDALISDLNDITQLKGAMKPNPEAREWFINWYEHSQVSPLHDDPRFGGYFERKHIHLLKAAMICCASESDSMIITRQHMERALFMLDAVEPSMVNAFGASGRSDNAIDIEDLKRVFKTSHQHTLTMKEISGLTWRDIPFDKLPVLLSQMVTMGLIKEKLEGGKLIYEWKEETQRG
jgi:hypothetical protein